MRITNKMRDYARRRDMARNRGKYAYDGHYSPEYDIRYGNSTHSPYDYARTSGGYQPSRQYDANYGDYGYGMRYDMARRRDYSRDYGEEETLSDDELMEWSRELLKDVEQKDKPFMTRENIIQRAKDMGVKFKHFTEDEIVVATLMMYTDYSKTLGTGNLDLYIRLAKDWLEDDDVEVMGGEKLATYYDKIVCGE